MTREIYVQGTSPREIAVTEDGQLVEYLLDEPAAAGAEAVYLGRVEWLVPGMQAAFVDIGQERNGFLPLQEKSRSVLLPRLQAGDRVLVQVKKEAQGTKGAFLTRDVTLCGEYVLFMPCNRYIGVSARVAEEDDRRALKEQGAALAGGACGLVMRQAALDAPEEAIRQELDGLRQIWERIGHDAPTSPAPSLLHRPRTLLDALLDDYLPRGVTCVVTDDPALDVPGVPLRREAPGLMERLGLWAQRDRALQRRVWLESGGNLIIDPCEAMTVIDVNTAKNTGRRDAEQTILRTDLEAAREIARQTRLRNLGGIILIDMIDLQEEAHREQVLQALREAFAADRVKTVVHGLTSLGLVEMTRKKTRAPLLSDWTQPCMHCGGTGRIPREEKQHG